MGIALYRKTDYSRLLKEEDTPLEHEEYRTPFRRDYSRLLHSPSFRRLQGKTQLFPGIESDFFRNRLTHSLEVTQIAKSIAIRLNHRYDKQGKPGPCSSGKGIKINLDIVEFAGLCHDLGHPPFGHQGEEELDSLMEDFGGFEGNAQTLRIVTKIEKKILTLDPVDGNTDKRVGLNLCFRTLASILKYDNVIPPTKHGRKDYAKKFSDGKVMPVKGYYEHEKDIVEKIKEGVLGNGQKNTKLKTIECQIMDVADDIAYSTYDLEDALKAGFISPLDMVFPDEKLVKKVSARVNRALKEEEYEEIKPDDVIKYLRTKIYVGFLDTPKHLQRINDNVTKENLKDVLAINMDHIYKLAQNLARRGEIRSKFTSGLVGRFIRGIELIYNGRQPALSIVRLDRETRIKVEILKRFTFESQINSPRLKTPEYRGKEIVREIFNSIISNDAKSHELLPKDVQDICRSASHKYKMRIVCDFVAGMTDRYAIEFYGRLKSEDPQTIFKPF